MFIRENYFNIVIKYSAYHDRSYDSKAIFKKIIDNG